MFAAIRIRGRVGLKNDIKYTLDQLRLRTKMHCILVKDDSCMKGMLFKVKDYITWGEIDDDTLKSLIMKRGRKEANARLTEKEALEVFDKVKATAKVPDEVKPVFRLNPPSKGFKQSVKQHYPEGEIGYRGKDINELLKRMI
jgi:large subunit ribosomal protein L30